MKNPTFHVLALAIVVVIFSAVLFMVTLNEHRDDPPLMSKTEQPEKLQNPAKENLGNTPDSGSFSNPLGKPLSSLDAQEEAITRLAPSQVADQVFPKVDLDVLAFQLPAEKFATYELMRAEFPNVDWTEIEPTHQAFLNKRSEFPLNLNNEQREAYAAWLAEVEPVSQALIRLRAEAQGIAASGVEDGQGLIITGFRDGTPAYLQGENASAAISTGASFVRWNPGLDPALGDTINGSEAYMTVSDVGEVFENPEFQLPNNGGSRILHKGLGGVSPEHSTHVAGTMAAWGYTASLQGMAPRGWLRTLINLGTSHISSWGMATPGQQTGVINPRTGNPQLKSVVGNASLGATSGGVPSISTRYTSTSASYDISMRDYPYYMFFTSTGNSGSGFETLTGAWKTSKNTISIGNVSDVARDSQGVLTGGGALASNSSCGPTYDGRIKPDFVGNGDRLTSPATLTGSTEYSGTSMASPNAAGSVALLMDYVRQRLPQQYLRHPTYKALLMSTADDLGNPGPDYRHGWGLVNVHAAAKIIRQHAESNAKRLIIEDSLSPSQTWTETYVSDGSSPIRVSIAWLDPAGTADTDGSRSPRLVNDLDVRLIGPGNTVYHPYVMPYTTGQGATPAFDATLFTANAVTGDNTTDPMEQVRIANPAAGTYVVQVTHKGALLSNEAQQFSVAVSGLRNEADIYDLTITPDTLSMQATIGQSASTPLTLTNTGTLPIIWSIPTTGYQFMTSDQSGGPAYVWNDIAATGTRVIGLGDDTNHGPFSLGFSMPFYGQNFSSIRICSNGWLSFTSSATTIKSSSSLPNSALPENLIAPLMRDLNLSTEGTVHYQKFGSDTFVIQFTDVPRFGSANASKKVTFQVVLKRDGTIFFYYQRTDDPAIGLVGIQNAAKNAGLTIAFDQAFLKPGLAVRIQTKPAWLSITPTSGTIAAGDATSVTMICNSTGLEEGIYQTTVFVNSNDADSPLQTREISFNVANNQATITTWPTASSIVYEQALSASTLTGGSASVPGAFTFDAPATIPNAGTYSAAVTYTPTDTANYDPVSGSVAVEVTQATPVITTWPIASAINYGQYFNTTTLTGGSASVSGTFALNDPTSFTGQDVFTFRVSDGESTSDPATVSITVGESAGTPDSLAFVENASRQWTPADVTTLAWYDAADTSTITPSIGGPVSQWNDKSGNARHVAQSLATQQPNYASNTITFDGANDYLMQQAAFMYAAGSADVYVVASVATTTDKRLISENRSTADSSLYNPAQTHNGTGSMMSSFIRADDNTVLFSNATQLSGSGAFSISSPKLYQWRDSGTRMSARVSGGSETGANYSRSKAITLNRFTIGGIGPRPASSTGSGFINAGVNEVVITSNLDDADRQKLEGYLAWKWNLQANLPADHPYKPAAPVVVTNHAPVANAQILTVTSGAPAAITLTGSDPENDPLTFEIVTQPTYGMLSGIAPNVTYTPPTPPAVGAHDVSITFTPADTNNYHSVTGTVSVTVNGSATPYDEWAAQYPDHDLSDPNEDIDNDGMSNFQEYAFGLDPTTPSAGVIRHANGVVTGRGTPTMIVTHTVNDDDFQAIFGRRKDYLSAGLVYQVHFSPDLATWVTSTATPTVVASDAEVEAVTLPYPSFVDTPRGPEKPQFFRVRISKP